jgi:phage-related protein
MKKKILEIVLVILCIVGAFSAIYFPESNLSNEIADVQNEILKEIVVSDEIKSEVSDVKDATINNEEIETKEIIKGSIDEEESIIDEGALETDAVVEQENISYDGDITGNGLSLLGAYQGLTYYNQRRFKMG